MALNELAGLNGKALIRSRLLKYRVMGAYTEAG